MSSTTATRPDLARIREDHWKPQTAAEDAFWDVNTHRLGTSAKQGHRSSWWAAIDWLLTAQLAFGELTQGEVLAELRKEEGSIYWPLLSDDPKFHADCPRCNSRVLIGKEGLCPECAYEFEED